MKKLRVIIVLPVAPLPFGNAAARWFYVLIKTLVDRGHDVTCFASCNHISDIAEVNTIFSPQDYDLRCYPVPAEGGRFSKLETLRRPYSYIFSRELQQDLAAEVAKGCDVLHCEVLFSGWLGLPHRDRTVVNVHYLHSLDNTFTRTHSLETKLRGWITDRAERKLMAAFPQMITLSERLSQHVRQANPQTNVHTVPLGIDFDFYPFAASRQPNPQPIVGLIGGFQWGPSYSAAERLITRLWPEIKQRVPNAKLQIVGRDAKPALAKFVDTPGLEIHSDVPDTLPYFERTDVMLYAPVAGSGMKVKVMEAFALGTPVVTNAEGIEGLPARDRVHAGICEDDRGSIDRTVELLTDPALAQQLRLNARALLEQYCSPAVTVSQIERVYQQIIG
jgi:polysaccharide biosynthesis protein PslH